MNNMKLLRDASTIAGATNSYTFTSFDAPKETKTNSSSPGSIILPFFGGLGLLILILAIHGLFWCVLGALLGLGEDKNKNSGTKQSLINQKPILDYRNKEQKATNSRPLSVLDIANTSEPQRITDVSRETADRQDSNGNSVKSTDQYEICRIKPHSKTWNDLHMGRITGSSAFYLKHNSLDSAIRRSNHDNEYMEPNEAIRRALRLKPKGAAEFAKEYGHDVKSVSFIKSLTHKKAGFSPDGVILNNEGTIQSIVCVKAFGRERHLASAHGIEEKVMYQAQFGLFVTGATHAYVVFYNPDIYPAHKQMIVKKVGRDEDIINLFKKRFDERSRSSSKTASSNSSRYSNAYALLNSYGKA